MPKLTKRQFEEMFREEILPYALEHERSGFPDKPRRRTLWNDTVDAYIRDGVLPEAAGNWTHPRWLENWIPSQRHHATAPKSQRAMYNEASRRSAEINETFLEMLPTMRRKDLERLIEKRPALWGRFAGYLTSGHVFADDPQAGKSHHATKKKSSAQLDREIAEWYADRSGVPKHHRDLLTRRGPGGGLRAGHLTPTGWHGDPLAIEDRKLRLEALREQPSPKFPKAHATKRRSHTTRADAKEAEDEYKALKKPGVTYRIRSRKVQLPAPRWNLED